MATIRQMELQAADALNYTLVISSKDASGWKIKTSGCCLLS